MRLFQLSPLFLAFFSSVTPISLPSRNKTCIVPSQYSSSNGTADDSAAIISALAKCSRNAVVEFSPGVNYNVFKPIRATNLSNVEIQMQGNLHLPQKIGEIQKLVRSRRFNHWFQLGGYSIDYIGSANESNGWINSYGQKWWDANPKNGTGIANRPHLMGFNVRNGTMQYFKSRKPIAWNVALSGRNIRVTNSIIDARSDTGSFPFNTDAFGVTGNNIQILNSTIYNGDDACAVQNGAHNVLFQGGIIGYQTHGLSVGSLGGNPGTFANVSNILFDDVEVADAIYAARFKSWIGGKGIAKNITWSNIRVRNVTFPIFVTQTYFNQGSAQTLLEAGTVKERPNNSSVMMEDFTFSNFTGTINTLQPGDGSCVSSPCWYNAGLPGLKHTEAVIIACNTEQSCRNFSMRDIKVVPQSLEPVSTICLKATAELNPKLGFECRNGTFAPK